MKRVNKNCFVNLNLLIVIIFLIDWSLAADFSYKDEPEWPLKFPQCGGQRQSPVSIELSGYDEGDPSAMFSMINYEKKPSSVKLKNVGHTIKLEFTWDKTEPPYIARGVFGEDEYVFDSMHFHWSRVSRHGSEHILLGYDGVMEMHLVHYNRNYGNKENATNYIDGLAMVGALINVTSTQKRRSSDDDYDNESLVAEPVQTSPAVSEILSNVGSVSTPGLSVDIEPFPISDVRPVQLKESSYIMYFGSFSSPPCTENVLRIMSTYPYLISEEQFQYLQSTVEFDHGDDHNNRPVQPMNGRKWSAVWGVAETID